MQSGTPRGFNLSSIPYFSGNGPVPGNFPPGQFPGFIGLSQSSPWGSNGMMPGDASGSGLHQPGAIRRGGGRYNNRSGPYDRRGNRNNTGNNGRLSPIRGMPSGMFAPGGRLPGNAPPYIPPGHPAAAMMAAGGFADAMGDGGGGHQQAAMGPREAVQGRSLKSYEDLDAVGGSGGGELNY